MINKEYLETKGFIHNPYKEEYVSNKTYFGISTGDDKRLIIFLGEEFGDIHIYYRANNGYEYTVFDGYIDTLSDFDNLLRMLRI
jgi:hypothetical protein